MFPLRPSSNLPTFLKAFLPDRKLQQLSLLSQHLPLLAPPGTLIVMIRHYISSKAAAFCIQQVVTKLAPNHNNATQGNLEHSCNKQTNKTRTHTPVSHTVSEEFKRTGGHQNIFLLTQIVAPLFPPPHPCPKSIA